MGLQRFGEPPPHLVERRHQQGTIAVVDLPRRDRLAALDQFVARGEHRHARQTLGRQRDLKERHVVSDAALDDARVTLYETDGRTFLAASGVRYDVILRRTEY